MARVVVMKEMNYYLSNEVKVKKIDQYKAGVVNQEA